MSQFEGKVSKSWSRPHRYFALTLVIIALVWLASTMFELIIPLAISALLAIVLNPAVSFVNGRTKLKRSWVVGLVYMASLALLVTAAVIVVPILIDQVGRLSTELESVITGIEETLSTPTYLMGFQLPLENMVSDIEMLSTDFIRTDILLSALQSASTNLGWALVVLVTTYTLLQDWPKLRNWLIGLAPHDTQPEIRRIFDEIGTVWESYLRGQLRLMIVVGLMTGLVSAAIGLPGAFGLGFLLGLADPILTVGPAIVTAVAALVAFFAGSTFLPISNLWFALLVALVYNIIKLIEDVWLRPRIMGHSMNLHPTVVFIGVIGALALGGVLVALIIIPMMGTAVIVGRYLHCKILDVPAWPDG